MNKAKTCKKTMVILTGLILVSGLIVFWKFIFGNDGVINAMLEMVGLEPVMWKSDSCLCRYWFRYI